MVKIWSVRFLLFVCFVSIVASCKTVKPVTSAKNDISIEKVYDKIQFSQYEYKTLNIKFNVNYEKKEQTMSLKGNIRILKDSIIWVTISPGLGIEAARLMCTNDSIYLLDKLNGSLTKGKYGYIKNLYKIDVDYHSLQAILTNNFFIYPTSKDEKNEFIKNFTISKDSTTLDVYQKTADMIENLIKIDKSTNKISKYLINDVPNRRSLNVKYKKSDNADIKNIPGFINIKSLNVDKFLIMDIEYTKVTVNEDLTFAFKVPSNYKIILQ